MAPATRSTSPGTSRKGHTHRKKDDARKAPATAAGPSVAELQATIHSLTDAAAKASAEAADNAAKLAAAEIRESTLQEQALKAQSEVATLTAIIADQSSPPSLPAEEAPATPSPAKEDAQLDSHNDFEDEMVEVRAENRRMELEKQALEEECDRLRKARD